MSRLAYTRIHSPQSRSGIPKVMGADHREHVNAMVAIISRMVLFGIIVVRCITVSGAFTDYTHMKIDAERRREHIAASSDVAKAAVDRKTGDGGQPAVAAGGNTTGDALSSTIVTPTTAGPVKGSSRGLSAQRGRAGNRIDRRGGEEVWSVLEAAELTVPACSCSSRLHRVRTASFYSPLFLNGTRNVVSPELRSRTIEPTVLMNREGLYVIIVVLGVSILGYACVLTYCSLTAPGPKRNAEDMPAWLLLLVVASRVDVITVGWNADDRFPSGGQARSIRLGGRDAELVRWLHWTRVRFSGCICDNGGCGSLLDHGLERI
ncbi:hypothetical protein MTO96_010867 [Rhipicephalus appendiculatus]